MPYYGTLCQRIAIAPLYLESGIDTCEPKLIGGNLLRGRSFAVFSLGTYGRAVPYTIFRQKHRLQPLYKSVRSDGIGLRF